jgi:hypothetical protein
METTPLPPICEAQKRFWCFHGVIVLLMIIGATAFPAEPTANDEAGVVGSWRVSGKDFERRYDISAGRNIKIAGSGIKDKRGRLTPQQDGSYLVQLDEDVVLRLMFTQANDRLVVECFTKKNLSLGLSPMWKITAVRMQPQKE